MYNELLNSARSQFPEWVRSNPRYLRLHLLNKWIDGEFYDFISIPFVQEKTSGNVYVPISNRRPHFVFNIPRMVAVKVARKLFAGKQKPCLVSEDQELLTAAKSLLHEGFFDTRMLDAAVKGSVGAVAMTFDFKKDGAGVQRIIFETHRSRDCFPVFDGLGELSSLRVVSTCYGQDFFEVGQTTDFEGKAIKAGASYWLVRVFGVDENVVNLPIPYDQYDPCNPEHATKLRRDDTRSTVHHAKVVTGHWMVNLTGAKSAVDGCCAWETALSSCIVLDYTLSQLTRGTWYAAAPTPVFKGKVINSEETDQGTIIAGPANVIQFAAEQRDPSGSSTGGGDAHLMETNGAGLSESRETCEMMRKFILEQIQHSRKDPDRMRTSAMSGAAMEQMDEDSIDLIQDLRTAFGDEGSLVVTKKALVVAKLLNHPLLTKCSVDAIDKLTYQWPSTYSLSSHELLETVQAITMAIGTETVEAEGTVEGGETSEGSDKGSKVGKSSSGSGGTSSSPSQSSGTSSSSSSAESEQSTAATTTTAGPQLLTEAEGRQIITTLLNLPPLAAGEGTVATQQVPLVVEE